LGNFALLPPLSRETEEGGRAPAAGLAGGPGRGGGRGYGETERGPRGIDPLP